MLKSINISKNMYVVIIVRLIKILATKIIRQTPKAGVSGAKLKPRILLRLSSILLD